MTDEYGAQLWRNTLEAIKGKINEPSYNTWFADTKLVSKNNHKLVVTTLDDITKGFIHNTYYDLVVDTLRDMTGEDYTVSFVTPGDSAAVGSEKAAVPDADIQMANGFVAGERDEAATGHPTYEQLIHKLRLNPKYTFDNFVIGKSNQYAHAACKAVAENMAQDLNNPKNYNPLFIHGGSGLGKTHLMQAIAHYILLAQPAAKIRYVSSETFTNEFIESIMKSKNAQFRERYRTCDVLLVDDIQFMNNKEGTLEEFFHTFNELYEANKQIIIASDRPPREIPKLEDRLRTRFEWGIITDIQKPDLETRIAILKKKAKMDNKYIPDDVIFYMAENIQSNIRLLEGMLLNITTFCDLNNIPITVETAKDVLSTYIQVEKPVVISGELIQDRVCETYGIRKDEIISKRRSRVVVVPRQIAMYLCRELTEMSLPEIGSLFGGRDHTTVMHAVDKVKEMMEKDLGMKGTVNGIRRDLTEKH